MKNESALIEAKQPELSLNDLRKRIAERERQIDLECNTALAHTARAVKLLIEQGADLLLVKKQVGHGGWMEWCADNFTKSITTANRYMRLAAHAKTFKDFETDPTSLREALRALEMLPEPEQREQAQLAAMVLPPIFSRLAPVSKWAAESFEEVKEWDSSRRDELKSQLRPIVELFNRL
jgi:hypothetical protein